MAARELFLVVQREFLSRVRKPTFLVMTLLGPLLILGLYGGIIWLALSEEKETLVVNVVDESEVRASEDIERLNRNQDIQIVHFTNNLEEATQMLAADAAPFNAILYLPRDVVNNPSGVTLGFVKRPGMSLVRSLEYTCQKTVENFRLRAFDINPEIYELVRAPFHIKQYAIQPDGSQSRANEAPYILGYVASLLMYISVLLYGAQTMRGVMEEKTSRVSEILASSVRPFHLMMGKILGVASVGLLQFLIWILFSSAGVYLIASLFLPQTLQDPERLQQLLEQQSQIQLNEGADGLDTSKIAELLNSVNLSVMIPSFLFFFLGGYLFYSALFAAVGSLVDSEADSQQFALPVTLPMIFSIAIGLSVLNNPDGRMAEIFSLIPFTSPVVMMVRIPFGVSWPDFLASAAILIISFVISVWISARIYRAGILLYGKKPRWKDVWRFISKD
ncbi:MAG: ABC transporter permease [Flavobacteriales bacterium]|nr:ABC transporter permease [Flavobacteriales bacterium]MDW8432669.1 ABC transporter permease [Flavobacteriales bacterium]